MKEELQKAKELQDAGKNQEALDVYLQLVNNGGNLEAEYQLGILYLKNGRDTEALECFEKCISGGYLNSSVYNYAGVILQSYGKIAKSVECFEKALSMDPGNISILNNLSFSYYQMGNKSKAIENLNSALSLNPSDPESYYNLAFIYQDTNENGKAVKFYNEVLKLEPAHYKALWNLGELHLQMEEYEKAEEFYKCILASVPDNDEVKFNLAFALENSGKYDEAESIYIDLVKKNKFGEKPCFNLANVYKATGRYNKALEFYKKAAEINEDSCELWNNLGLIYLRLFEFERAGDSFLNALKIKPFYSDALSNLAALYYEMEKPQKALDVYDQALGISADDSEIRFNKAVALLASGNFKEGFAEYEFRDAKLKNDRKYKRTWQGENPGGKKILVIDEQGIGDAVQFVRYIKIIKDQGAEIIFHCRKSLIRLFENISWIDKIVDLNCEFEDYDYAVSLLSLPNLLNIAENETKTSFPYLELPVMNKPKQGTVDADKKIKVGIIWKGNPDHKYDYKRSIDLEIFSKHFTDVGAKIYSLQYQLDEKESKLLEKSGIENTNNENTDLLAAAGIMQELDLVITVDTAVAHLAGAMGLPVWVLLSTAPDWRWGNKTEQTGWYPSMKLFRQTKSGEWESVLDRVKLELSALLTPDAQNDYLQFKLLAFENHEKNNLEQAEKYYKEALNIKSFDPELLYWLAGLYFSKNQLMQAEEYYSKLTEFFPGYNEEVYNNLLNIYSRSNNPAKVGEIYNQGVKLFPQSPRTHNNYGVYLASSGEKTKALECFEKALQAEPGFKEAQINFAEMNADTGNVIKAIEIYKTINSQYPGDPFILKNLGNYFLKIKDFSSAENYYRESLKINPSDYDLLNNFGFAQQRQNKIEEAELSFLKAIKICESAGLLYNLGNNYYLANDFILAEKYYKKALQINPAYREAKVGLGFICLSEGRFEEGWEYFSYSLSEHPVISKSGLKKWDGADPVGKTLLVYTEQGIGDTIHFSRYFQSLFEVGANIKLLCDEAVAEIFKSVPQLHIITKLTQQDIEDSDFYCSLLNIPGQLVKLNLFDNSCHNLLNGDAELPEEYNNILSGEKLNVGFVWRGNPEHQFNYNRNADLKEFSRLFNLSSINFISLQYDAADELTPYLNNYANLKKSRQSLALLAGLVGNLDLVITVDTMVAHLAGTLGKEVWILLPFASDWRWMRNTERSYLYPTARLFRQKKLGEWSPVFERVVNELAERSKELPSAESEESAMIMNARNAFEKNEISRAELILTNALEKYPESAEAYMLLGYIHQVSGRLATALEAYLNVVRIDPGNYNAYSNLGVILKDLMKFDEAERCLKISIKLNDKNAVAYNNLAIINHLKGDFNEGFENLKNALALNPNYVEVLINLSNHYDYHNDFQKAVEVINRAVELQPGNHDARFNRALILLKENFSREALQEYEWRKNKPGYQKRYFEGEELNTLQIKGKTIVVYDEQGFGDTIQFSRYLKLLKQKGAKVILECHRFLVNLMKSCDGVDEVYPREYVEKNSIIYDYHVALLSLPLLFFDEYPAIPSEVPYIKGRAIEADNWHESYINSGSYNIGIVWRGKQPVYNLQRSTRLEFFEEIAKIKSVKLFSLQKEDITDSDKIFMEENGITDLSEQLTDFNKTAGIIKKLDLVITIDTAVAHLAGALGVKTFTMVSKKADWRWYRDTDRNPWYPTMKIFRQETYNNWTTIFNNITKEINSEINKP